MNYQAKSTKPTKPTLLYIITKADIGGAQANVYDLIEGFSKEYDVHLAVGNLGPLVDDVRALGIPVHIIPHLTRNIQSWGDVRAIQECIALYKSIRPSIVHAHSSKAGVIARVAGFIYGVPCVFTAHGWGFTPGAPKLRRMVALLAERLLAVFTPKLVAVCEYDRRLALKQGVGNSQKLVTVRYGIKNFPAAALATPQDQLCRLLMVARFNEQKDQATLLRAIALLKHPNLHLDLAGSGPDLEACKTLANSLGIADQVSFLGDRHDIPDLLAKTQLFVLSTHYEGLPISILEAMRAGLPVIGSEVNGIPEEVEHGVTGLIVPPRDPEHLAKAIAQLVENPQMRMQMGQSARKKFETEFTIDRMVGDFRTLYSGLLDRSSPQTEVTSSMVEAGR
jgi:glycosyltransferase involved in cell wall biosynthesis